MLPRNAWKQHRVYHVTVKFMLLLILHFTYTTALHSCNAFFSWKILAILSCVNKWLCSPILKFWRKFGFGVYLNVCSWTTFFSLLKPFFWTQRFSEIYSIFIYMGLSYRSVRFFFFFVWSSGYQPTISYTLRDKMGHAEYANMFKDEQAVLVSCLDCADTRNVLPPLMQQWTKLFSILTNFGSSANLWINKSKKVENKLETIIYRRLDGVPMAFKTSKVNWSRNTNHWKSRIMQSVGRHYFKLLYITKIAAYFDVNLFQTDINFCNSFNFNIYFDSTSVRKLYNLNLHLLIHAKYAITRAFLS